MNQFEPKQILEGYNPHTNQIEEGEIKKVKVTFQIKQQMITGYTLDLVNKDGDVLTNDDLERYNDLAWSDLYRQKNNLLTSGEIKNIREKRHLTQEGLAKFLELGKKDIARYENGAIQTKVIDLLLRLVDDDASFVQMSRVFKEASIH